MISKYKTKGGIRWKYQFQLNGTQYRTRGFLTQAEAKVAESAARLSRKQFAIGCLVDIATNYLDYVERNQTAKTYDQKKSHIKKFIHFAGDIPADQLTPHTCQKFLDNFTDTASNTHRKTLSAWLRWCIDMRLVNIFRVHSKNNKPLKTLTKVSFYGM